MLLDARSIAAGETLTTDVCIVGAGAAGIATALGLLDAPARILVLEGGGHGPAEATQQLYAGTTSGHPYYALDACRMRCLGGSTNFWGGWCHPLEAIDFEECDWVPHSGWPFPKAALDRQYRRAHTVCDLGGSPQEAVHPCGSEGASLIANRSLSLRDTAFHIAPRRFGEEFRATLRDSSTISVLLHGNAVEIVMDVSHRTAERVDVATVAGNRFAIRAGLVVLAAGGIENPRLLLASRRGRACGIGNEHDLVGRFFADHLHVPIGVLNTPPRVGLPFYRAHRSRGATVRGAIAMSEEARRRERLLGSAVTLHDAGDPHDVLSPTQQPDGYRSLRCLVKSSLRGERPDNLVRHLGNVASDLNGAARLAYRKMVKRPARTLLVGVRAEQAPNALSRVTLDNGEDRFGMPQARLHWDVTANDLESVERSIEILDGELSRQNVTFERLPRDRWLDRIAGGAHHTGTTRMHRDPTRGVVDEHARVHGTSNLYVTGSSVFPTAGWAPPTLTIVALAIRLAEHLKDRLTTRVA